MNMKDGRNWTDILVTVENFNKIINQDGVSGFDITKVSHIYVPYNGALTIEDVEDDNYTSGCFTLIHEGLLMFRVCDGLSIPLDNENEPGKDVSVIMVNLKDNVVSFNDEVIFPWYDKELTDSTTPPLYYRKPLFESLTEIVSLLPNPEEHEKAFESFRKRFEGVDLDSYLITHAELKARKEEELQQLKRSC